MTPADLDRLDELVAYTMKGGPLAGAPSFVLAREVRDLVAEVRRLWRGLEAMTVQCDYADNGRLLRCWPIDIRDNLLAGREWSDNGTTAAMPRKGNDNGV